MDQKEDLISQHDTLKKAYDEIAQNKLIFEVRTFDTEYYRHWLTQRLRKLRTLTWISKESE
jgi:hypothetical protein